MFLFGLIWGKDGIDWWLRHYQVTETLLEILTRTGRGRTTRL